MTDILILFSGICVNKLQMCTLGVTVKEDRHVLQISMSNGIVLEESFISEEGAKFRFQEITGVKE